MRLRVIAFGKLKTPGLREAADYYQKLLRPWAPVEEVELKSIAVPDKSPATRRQIQEKEAEILSQRLSGAAAGRGRYYLLDETGKTMSTQGWSELVRQWENDAVPEAALCIGSSLGFSDSVRKSASGILSLGPQTLPHELARVVLLEQLYRAWSVVRGHPYHNEGA